MSLIHAMQKAFPDMGGAMMLLVTHPEDCTCEGGSLALRVVSAASAYMAVRIEKAREMQKEMETKHGDEYLENLTQKQFRELKTKILADLDAHCEAEKMLVADAIKIYQEFETCSEKNGSGIKISMAELNSDDAPPQLLDLLRKLGLL